MNPVTIEAGLQVIAQLLSLIQLAHASGSGAVSGEEWAAVIGARNTAQKKLDDDIALKSGAKATPPMDV